MLPVSVVMSTYNRENTIKEAIDSILNQSFCDFEFIIMDDASTDSTEKIIKSYDDDRILYLKNHQNCGCSFNYHVCHNIAKGKYVVHLDDDDVSFRERIAKQVDFMEENLDIALSGTYIETFGENKRPSWVFYYEPKILNIIMNFYNPICHSSVIYRKGYFDKHFINYDVRKKCSQDYDLYKQIVLSGGKIANLPEILTKYRMHKNRITDVKDTQNIQIDVANEIKKELLRRFFNEEQILEFEEYMRGFPYNEYGIYSVIKGLEMLKQSQSVRGEDCSEEIKRLIEDVKNKKFIF